MLYHIYNIFDISRETYNRNGVETIVDSDETIWLNGKHIKERWDHKNSPIITRKHH